MVRMDVSLPPLNGATQLIGDGGASAHAEDHSPAAVQLALRLGAHGVSLSAWPEDGRLVVSRSPQRRRRRRAKPTTSPASERPELRDVLGATPPGTLISLTVDSDDAFRRAVEIADAEGRINDLWIGGANLERMERWRSEHPTLHLVLTLDRTPQAGGLERDVAALRRLGVEALQLRASDWTSGHVALAHRFGRAAWARDADYPHIAARMLTIGIDVLAGRDVDVLVDAARAARP